MKKSTCHQKDVSLEIMRIIAIFFVIFNHTGDKGFYLFSTYTIGSIHYWLYLPISVFCKFSVPVFYMISGALLLRKEEDIRTVLKKRVARIAIVIVVINLVYYILGVFQGDYTFYGKGNIIDFVSIVFSGKDQGFMWFLYRYLVFLLFLPIIQKLNNLLSKKEYSYIFVLALGFMTIKPILEVIISCELNNSFGFLSVDFLVYPLLGYFLCNFIDYGAISGKKIALSWIINIILILISCFFVFYRMRKTGEVTEGNSQQFHNMFVLVNASVIFVTIKKYLKVNKHKKISTGALLVGECVFGVYLFHIFVMRLEFVGAIYDFIIKTIRIPLFSCLVWCLAIFLVSFLVSFILKRIPFIKKFI